MNDPFHRKAGKAPDEKLQLASSIKISAEILDSKIRDALAHGDADEAHMQQALYRLEEAVMWATKGLTVK